VVQLLLRLAGGEICERSGAGRGGHNSNPNPLRSPHLERNGYFLDPNTRNPDDADVPRRVPWDGWDIGTSQLALETRGVAMKGRRIADEKAEQARLLRQKGFSVREIAKRLHISKSSADRFTQGIPEQSDEPQTPEGQDMSQNSSELEDSEFHDLLSAKRSIWRFIKLADEMDDDAGVREGRRGLRDVHDMMKDYYRRNYPGFPVPSFLQHPDAGQNRSGGFFSDSTSALLASIAAEVASTNQAGRSRRRVHVV
jgi:transposase